MIDIMGFKNLNFSLKPFDLAIFRSVEKYENYNRSFLNPKILRVLRFHDCSEFFKADLAVIVDVSLSNHGLWGKSNKASVTCKLHQLHRQIKLNMFHL